MISRGGAVFNAGITGPGGREVNGVIRKGATGCVDNFFEVRAGHLMVLQKRIVIDCTAPGLDGLGEDNLEIAVDIFLPDAVHLRPGVRVLFCQPGGALDKGYFSLTLEDGDQQFNFAAHMNARGFIVIALDHLGVGASSRPRDGFALTPAVLIAANAQAVARLGEQLREGTLHAALPALRDFIAIGVGHSMGAMLSTMQQARHTSYAAVALLGFGTRGLPDYLSPEARECADDAARANARISELARALGDDPYPRLAIEGGRAGSIYGGGADRRAVAALAGARTNLLAVAGLFSMIPGSTAPDCSKIETPVFLGVGDRDISGVAHEIPTSFSGSRDVTLVVLPETGHSHFLFVSMTYLCERLASWIDTCFPAGIGSE